MIGRLFFYLKNNSYLCYMKNKVYINMKKVALFLVILLTSTVVFSQNETQDFERLDTKKVVEDVKIIKQEADSTFYYIKGTIGLLKESVQLFGVKKTIQMHSGVFLPIVIFLVLYLLWLKGRKKD